MKNLKKVLALVLAFACAFTMFAGAAFTDEADIQAKDAVNMLTALGVIEGYEDGSFNPDGVVTRAEMAKMIFVVRNNTIDDSAYANNTSKLTDITNHWAKGYIKFCESQGIIAGYGDNTFKPDATVTGVEAAKMLLVLTGYDADKAGLTGTAWATNTLRYAGSAGILDDVGSGLESGLPRQYAAQMIYNTLDTNRVKWSTDSDSFDDNLGNGYKETVGYAYMGLTKSVGILTTVSKDSLTLTGIDEAESDKVYSGSNPYATNFTKVKEDYSSLLGQKVKVMFKDGKTNNVLGVYAVSDNEAYTVNASEVESDGDKVKFGGKSYSIESEAGNNSIAVYFTNIEGDEYSTDDAKFTSQAGVTYTATEYTVDSSDYYAYKAAQVFDDWDTSSAVMQFVDSDGNGRFDSVIITDYAAAEVTSVTSSKVVAGKSYEFDEENIDDDLKADDWAIISYDRYNDCTRVAKADVITGKLDGLKKNSTSENYNKGTGVQYNEYQIGDEWYNGATDKDNRTDISTVKAGDEVEAVVVNGVAWKIKRASGDGSLSNVTDVAMVVNKDAGIGGNQVKLQFFNDTTKVVDVDDDSTIKYASLKVGALYEYSISGGEYSFENLSKDDDYYGDYTYVGTASYTAKDDALNGKKIDDTAKVILFEYNGKDTGNDSKVITGKQLKALESSAVTYEGHAAYFTADVNGLTRVAAIAVKVNKLPETTTSNDFYGYILSDAKESGTNEVSYNVLLEGADEAVTVYEKNAKTGDRKKNTLIGYKSLDGEDADKRYIDDVHLYKLGETNFGLGAITDVNGKQTTVQIAGWDGSAVQNYERDVTADTVVFYIDTDAKTGSSTGSIRKATKWYSDASGAQIVNGSDKYIANALYLIKDSDDLEVLVVEAGDNQFRGKYADDYNADNKVNDTVDIRASYAGISDVKADGNSVLGKSVDKGTSLTVTVEGVTGLKTKVSVTGGTISGSDTVTGTAKTVTVVADGSASVLGLSTSMVDGKIAKVPAAANDTDISGWTVTTGVGTKKLTDGAIVNIGETVTVKVKPDSAVAAGETYTVNLMNGTTKLGTATFTYGDATAKEISFQMPETDGAGITLTLSADVKTETVADVKIAGVEYLGADGYTTDTRANVRSVKITFSKAVDETEATKAANYICTGGRPNVENPTLNEDGTVVTCSVENLINVTTITVQNVVATDGGTLTNGTVDMSSLTQ